jgi:hypothetical protein
LGIVRNSDTLRDYSINSDGYESRGGFAIVVSGALSMTTTFTRSVRVLFGLAILALGEPLACAADPQPSITPGSEQGAKDYYAKIAGPLKFELDPRTTKLDDFLQYLGYPTSADKLRLLDPAILMNPARVASPDGLQIPPQGLAGASVRPGDILATRFFAPKIVNIDAAAKDLASLKVGWRKLVRLKARPDSRAARAGVEAAIVLFNFFAPAGQDPFQAPSINTQVMLLAPSHPERLFWLDFDPQNLLGLALTASFDAANLPNGGTRDYFVPDGCNACHGSIGNLRPPMVNYLDTDHWFDRLDDVFAVLKTANTAVLFDAHTNDPTQGPFVAAFDVIRQFNEEALAQNALVQGDTFEAQAARTWLQLHAQSDEHFPPVARAFGPEPRWQASEAEGLGRLNRYCFRCHGSVRFSIFNRQAVVDRAGQMRQRLAPSQAQQRANPTFKMPPDQTLPQPEIDVLDQFLATLN